jgi:hypothetical protein
VLDKRAAVVRHSSPPSCLQRSPNVDGRAHRAHPTKLVFAGLELDTNTTEEYTSAASSMIAARQQAAP